MDKLEDVHKFKADFLELDSKTHWEKMTEFIQDEDKFTNILSKFEA